MKYILACALAACAVFASQGQARSDESFTRFDESHMRAIAAALSHDIRDLRASERGYIAEMRTNEGLNYFLIASVCDERGCQGLHSIVTYMNETGLTPATVNQINIDRAAVKTTVEGDTVYFSRYDITDGGATVASLAASVSLTVTMARAIASDLAHD
ncbi:YbjN domain-containing protein [Alkalicaulis satelles]|uniref:YbjN domain-containing protein n=1 Tax=Alkalicaulis satelles TaxID=2609175 RepID=A0A5M6ZHW5_9PROT|nr:YbjN domain-containing protein [Alkalicaulis satelles]KAA5803394.1 YbjN domain-containing protein [Alkalicaulis satelles]